MLRSFKIFSAMMVFILVAQLFMPISTQTVSAAGNAYYVSTTGNDSNPGTQSKPFKTIQKGVNAAQAGDTVYIRGGTYHEMVEVTSSGTVNNPITISGYDGAAVIDGQNTLPQGEYQSVQFTPLLKLSGKYLIVENLQVKNSRGRGMVSGGDYNILRNLLIKTTNGHGVCLFGDYTLIENCEIDDCSRDFIIGPHPWPATLVSIDNTGTIIRNCYVHDSYGEGICILRSSHNIVEDSISHNNKHGIYLDHAPYVLVQRNVVYYDDNYWRANPGGGIAINNEFYAGLNYSMGTDQIIVNNIVNHANEGFGVWRKRPDSAIHNSVVANNTFINIVSNGIRIAAPQDVSDTNSYIENNIVSVLPGGTLAATSGAPHAGITFRNNNWASNVAAWFSNPNDVIGDAKLAKTGSALSGDYYKLTSTSPGINKGRVVSQVTEDFLGTPRGSSPDIGALEYESDTPPVSSSFGFWSLDETSGTTAFDSSGNGNNGTVNGASWVPDGKSDGALEFDGTDDYVALPFILNPANTDFTAACWIKTDSSALQLILQQLDLNGTGRAWLQCNNQKLETCIGGGAVASSTTLQNNTWYHVGVVKSGTSVKLYIDGEPDSDAVKTAESSQGTMAIGAHKTLKHWFDGLIDEVRIYNSALSDTQMLELFESYSEATPIIKTKTFSPAEDTFATENNPANPMGSEPTIIVHSAAGYKKEGFIKFDITGITEAVQSVKLKMNYVFTNGTPAGKTQVWSNADTTWTEDTLTWDDRPVKTALITEFDNPTELGTWLEVDLTGYVTGNGTYSLTMVTESCRQDYASKENSDSSTWPYLEIVYLE